MSSPCSFSSFFFFFKQKTAYEMRISDWSSDVCSSDLPTLVAAVPEIAALVAEGRVTVLRSDSTPSRSVLNALAAMEQPGPLLVTTADHRSEERRVGKECVSTCRSRWSPYPSKKKKNTSRTSQQAITTQSNKKHD